MEPTMMLIGSFLLAAGLFGGWYCYSKVSADTVDDATMQIAHGIMPGSSLWLIGAMFGLLLMVSGMVLIFVSMVGVRQVLLWINWFQTVFG
jgi:hypothetical protein